MDHYYKKQLHLLREESAVFARQYPALAPMLMDAGHDPDVERILEGTAFLCGKIEERLDQGSPELVQALIRLLFPQALLPMVSVALMAFQLQKGFTETLHVPAGAQVGSTPVDGVSCLFSTTAPLDILPFTLTALPPAADGRISLRLQSPVPLKLRLGNELRLHLGGAYTLATERLHALLLRLSHVEVAFENASGHRLPPNSLQHAPLPLEDFRLPSSAQRNRSYMEAIRYFTLPQQLLFLRLDGLNRLPCPETATSMTITFCLQKPFETLPDFSEQWAMLNVVPAANVFNLSAEPLTVDHTQEEYLIRPHEAHSRHIEILSVEKVNALLPGGVVEPCTPYERLTSPDASRLYSLRCQPVSGADASTPHLITLLHKPGEKPESLVRQTLSIDLRCCNLALPNRLRGGDINRPTDSSPAQAVFSNITAPTPTLPRSLDDSLLWRFLSHLNTNLLSSCSAEALRSMLELYIPGGAKASEQAAANLRRCSGIESFSSNTEDMLFKGKLLRGQRLTLTLTPASFTSPGDMFLFGSMIDRFLAGYATINSYFRLALVVTGTGESHLWPPRLGEKQLL